MNWYFKIATTWNKEKENNPEGKRKGMFDWSLLCCGKKVRQKKKRKGSKKINNNPPMVEPIRR